MSETERTAPNIVWVVEMWSTVNRKFEPTVGARLTKHAEAWTKAAIQAVRDACDPNPFREADSETIAAEILSRMAERSKGESQ